jgi:hypothetical protein
MIGCHRASPPSTLQIERSGAESYICRLEDGTTIDVDVLLFRPSGETEAFFRKIVQSKQEHLESLRQLADDAPTERIRQGLLSMVPVIARYGPFAERDSLGNPMMLVGPMTERASATPAVFIYRHAGTDGQAIDVALGVRFEGEVEQEALIDAALAVRVSLAEENMYEEHGLLLPGPVIGEKLAPQLEPYFEGAIFPHPDLSTIQVKRRARRELKRPPRQYAPPPGS